MPLEEQVPPGPLQTSTVQVSPSLQSPLLLQQLGSEVELQVPPGPEQVSVVQALPSLQSASFSQQPAMSMVPQPPGSKQPSTVQRLLSLQLNDEPDTQAPD